MLSYFIVLLIVIFEVKGMGLSVFIMGVELWEREGCLLDVFWGRYRLGVLYEVVVFGVGFNFILIFLNWVSGWGR